MKTFFSIIVWLEKSETDWLDVAVTLAYFVFAAYLVHGLNDALARCG